MNNFFLFLSLIWNIFKTILKILFGNKKNIFFIEGGFGVISTHCHLISNLDSKDNLLVWLTKEEFNPIEMINFWRQKIDVISLKLPIIRKKTFLKYIKKITLFF